jgi:hypothetical protein
MTCVYVTDRAICPRCRRLLSWEPEQSDAPGIRWCRCNEQICVLAPALVVVMDDREKHPIFTFS